LLDPFDPKARLRVMRIFDSRHRFCVSSFKLRDSVLQKKRGKAVSPENLLGGVFVDRPFLAPRSGKPRSPCFDCHHRKQRRLPRATYRVLVRAEPSCRPIRLVSLVQTRFSLHKHLPAAKSIRQIHLPATALVGPFPRPRCRKRNAFRGPGYWKTRDQWVLYKADSKFNEKLQHAASPGSL